MNVGEFDQRVTMWAEEAAEEFRKIARETKVPLTVGYDAKVMYMAMALRRWAVAVFLPWQMGHYVDPGPVGRRGIPFYRTEAAGMEELSKEQYG